ncbi:hypothetical protein M9Y10_012297 [Tritrichomonas musculus]|uniref:Uncharacterized protein n=1 Tax=Tritrichomonas musculus TaxID=1915356 RepID=A0ABR2ICX5_9EUKA
MSYRGIPQYSQGYPQISPQPVLGGNQSSKIKRGSIGRQPGNNLGIQPIAVSNPYGDLTPQPQNIPQQQGPIHIAQTTQQPVQYFVQPPTQPLQQPQQFNRIQHNAPVYPQYMQTGYSYPVYQPKNNGISIVSNMPPVSSIQHNTPDPSMINQHQLQQSFVQSQQIQQIPPQAPPHQHIGPHPTHSQEPIIYQTQYPKGPIDYIQMQPQKIGLRQPSIDTKPIIQSQNQLHQTQPQMVNHYQQTMQQQQPQQQMPQQQKMESALNIPMSPFIPDYNSPPAGPFNIIGRGNLPSINFIYTSSDL